MDADVYYSPEKFGLTTVGEFDMSSGSYEFDLFVVWRNEAGQFLWGQDSGCSCPSPFEMTSLSDLSVGNAHEAAAAIQAALAERGQYDREAGYGETDAADLIGKIMAFPPVESVPATSSGDRPAEASSNATGKGPKR